MLIKIITKNEKETRKLGEILAQEILKTKPAKKAFFICLQGNLGSGKTTFVQGLAKGLGIREKILSPTFVIIKSFPIKKSYFKKFYHLDCYRLKSGKEILKLNFQEIAKKPYHLVVVEWSEKIKKFLPKNNLWIKFFVKNKKEREIKIF